ncbi:MAG: phosphoribosyltransferase [Saprospiraceae bacterium]|nr:phosphoribosyltransferase [Saprospiraceae bacterium]
MVILNQQQIENKIRRMASEIYECHAESGSLILAGINNKGYDLALILQKTIEKMGHTNVSVCRLRLNPAQPIESEVNIDIPVQKFNDSNVVVIDDVANSGRTLFFALQAFLKVLTKKLETCVLVERMHKSYPISVEYVGVRLATTVKQNIEVIFNKNKPLEAQMF